MSELYAWLLGKEWQLPLMDERLADINITNPEEVDDVMAALFGAEDAARLDEVAEFLSEFALQVRQFGPKGYLLSKAHRPGESVDDPVLDGEDLPCGGPW